MDAISACDSVEVRVRLVCSFAHVRRNFIFTTNHTEKISAFFLRDSM